VCPRISTLGNKSFYRKECPRRANREGKSLGYHQVLAENSPWDHNPLTEKEKTGNDPDKGTLTESRGEKGPTALQGKSPTVIRSGGDDGEKGALSRHTSTKIKHQGTNSSRGTKRITNNRLCRKGGEKTKKLGEQRKPR